MATKGLKGALTFFNVLYLFVVQKVNEMQMWQLFQPVLKCFKTLLEFLIDRCGSKLWTPLFF